MRGNPPNKASQSKQHRSCLVSIMKRLKLSQHLVALSRCITTNVIVGVSILASTSAQADVTIQTTKPVYSTNTTYATSYNPSKPDRISQLIYTSEAAYNNRRLTIDQNTRIRPYTGSSQYPNYATGAQNGKGIIFNNLDFNQWLNVSKYRVNEVAQYQKFLASRVGVYNVPPMNQLLTTARSWEKCGYAAYQLPPKELWHNMVPTLNLYARLKSQGILPQSTQIRSVYRSPELNRCAGGAAGSKHMTNGAIDVWVPGYDDQPWYQNPLRNRLCQFWGSQGRMYNFGLGIYATGAIHLDTQGYRLWGRQHTPSDSACRYVTK